MDHQRVRTEAIKVAQDLLKRKPVFLDTETTGLGQKDEIIEISIIGFKGEILLDTLVKPTIKIPSEATRVHKITNKMVSNSPTWEDSWPLIKKVLDGKVVGIYNAEYDIKLIKQSNKKSRIPWRPPYTETFCIMEIFAKFYGEWSEYHRSYTWKSLENAANHFNISFPVTHRAKDDATLAREILRFIASEGHSKNRGRLNNTTLPTKTVRTPEEKEFERKKQELNNLEDILANKELELATLQGELNAFEKMYLNIVGVKLAELDEINAQIAEHLAKQAPKDRTAKKRAEEARKQSETSKQAHDFKVPPNEIKIFSPSEELKDMYRRVAKEIHPDLASDEKDREYRDELMKKVNAAYKDSDISMLQDILEEWKSSPEHVKGEGIGVDLIRIIRKIDQVEKRIKQIDEEISVLKTSELNELKQRVGKAEKENRDLLNEMAEYIETQIHLAKQQLNEMS